MVIRFITLVVEPLTTLHSLLAHYTSLGVTHFHIFLHCSRWGPSLLPAVSRAADICPEADVQPVYGDWLIVQEQILTTMQSYPDDWFLIADHDEFQLYPGELQEILKEADRRGFDHIRGCWIDRFAEDGSLPALDESRSIWDQYPIGAFFSYAIGHSGFRKVAAAKGRIHFTNSGHHTAVGGNEFPITELLIEVHHFKWTAGVVEYVRNRQSPASPWNEIVRTEGGRIVRYFERHNGRVHLQEPGLFAGKCEPHCPHWEFIRQFCLLFDLRNSRDEEVVESLGHLQKRG